MVVMEAGDGDTGEAMDAEQVSLLRATVDELRAMLEAERAQSRSVYPCVELCHTMCPCR